MARPEKNNLDHPDQRVEPEGVTADVVQVGDASTSRSIYLPGAHCALGGRRLGGNRRAEQSCQTTAD